jgi:hypothetical protein
VWVRVDEEEDGKIRREEDRRVWMLVAVWRRKRKIRDKKM